MRGKGKGYNFALQLTTNSAMTIINPYVVLEHFSTTDIAWYSIPYHRGVMAALPWETASMLNPYEFWISTDVLLSVNHAKLGKTMQNLES
jgi:hypothetical protein